jgi:hypothetical protein
MIFATANRKFCVIAAGKNPHLRNVNSGFSPRNALTMRFSLRKIFATAKPEYGVFASLKNPHWLDANSSFLACNVLSSSFSLRKVYIVPQARK